MTGNISHEVEIVNNGVTLSGTLMLPQDYDNSVVVMIIQGSGPTDRNGNNPYAGDNNSLRFLAEELCKKGIASLRYDKRGTGKSNRQVFREEDLIFDDFVDDAISCLDFLGTRGFQKIIPIGHSEGSMIGVLAAIEKNVEALISISGPASPPAKVILKQLKNRLPEGLYLKAESIMENLENAKITENIPPELINIFRQPMQPFLISWFKQNPIENIKKLKIPVLIIQGTTDIQVTQDQGTLLHENSINSKFCMIQGMNHVLKMVDGGLSEQIKSYADPDLPLSTELIEAICSFISTRKS